MRAIAVLALLVGCKDTPAPASQPAAPAAIDWPTCEQSLGAAVPEMVAACRVCDWDPILRWNVPTANGGPKRSDIENAMTSCKAFCNGEAKLKFLGTLDDARGSSARTPWRQLGQICKGEVSAVPDQRFMGGHYFALDRIARAAAARGGDAAKRLAQVQLPLPPVTVVGTGVPLAEVTTRTTSHGDKGAALLHPAPGSVQITLLGDGIYVGRLPKATLGANGVTVDLGADGYPGRQVTLDQLPAALQQLVGDDKGPVLLLAPKVMPAKALAPIVNAAGVPLHLAVIGHDTPKEWAIPAALPTPLRSEALGQTTVQDLAIVPP